MEFERWLSTRTARVKGREREDEEIAMGDGLNPDLAWFIHSITSKSPGVRSPRILRPTRSRRNRCFYLQAHPLASSWRKLCFLAERKFEVLTKKRSEFPKTSKNDIPKKCSNLRAKYSNRCNSRMPRPIRLKVHTQHGRSTVNVWSNVY